MIEQQRHGMIMEKTLPSGEEEWYCPTCGRRMLITWYPEFKRTILETGDDYAIHAGGKGGLQIGSLQIQTGTASPDNRIYPSADDPRLIPWSDWLKKVGFDNLWNDEA